MFKNYHIFFWKFFKSKSEAIIIFIYKASFVHVRIVISVYENYLFLVCELSCLYMLISFCLWELSCLYTKILQKQIRSHYHFYTQSCFCPCENHVCTWKLLFDCNTLLFVCFRNYHVCTWKLLFVSENYHVCTRNLFNTALEVVITFCTWSTILLFILELSCLYMKITFVCYNICTWN